MDLKKVKQLAITAAKARLWALEAVNSAKSGHLGGSFSAIDIITALYFEVMKVDPEASRNPERDRFILSKGHCSPACYSVLALKGYFPLERLYQFRNVNADLSGHVEMNHVNGVDMSAGSLGQGLSAGVGMALAGKYDKKDYRVFVVMGDGEIAEGQIWEAAMAAAHYKLDNLIGFIDVNSLQIDGTTEDVMNSGPLDKKWEAFGWHVISVDGHDFEQIVSACDEKSAISGKPTMVLCKTVKGKGVSFMENQVGWHGKAPSDEEYSLAKKELEESLTELEQSLEALEVFA